MATLQKFKLLATQCAIAGSPSRSPTTSPVIQLRRRKTLRMLLGRSGSGRRIPRREEPSDRPRILLDPPEKSKDLLSHTLKDLFVSSPEEDDKATQKTRNDGDLLSSSINRGSCLQGLRCGGGSPRPLTAAFRHRLIRRAWRPVLVAIPE